MPVLLRFLALPPILVAAAVAAWLINNAPSPAQQVDAPDGLPVRVASVVAQDIWPAARGWGSVRAADTWAAVAEVRGQVIWRHPDLETGKLIPAGTEVLKIDPADYQLAMSQSEADLQALQAEAAQIEAEAASTRRVLALEEGRLRLAEADLKRVRDLVDQGINPQTRADETEKALLLSRRTVTELQNMLALLPSRSAGLQAQTARTEAAIARSRRDLDHTVVVTPFDLRIRGVEVELYQWVTAGQKLVQGDGIARVEVVVQIPLPAFRRLLTSMALETDTLTAVGAGPAARMTAELHPLIDPAQIWPATVSRVEGGLDPKARTVPVVVTVDDPYTAAQPPARLPLVPNMQVEIALTGAPLNQVIAIPEAALHGETAYVLGAGNTLELRPVTPAFRQDGLVILREGLTAGETVVLDDIAPALPGMRLFPVETAASGKTR